MRTLGTFPSYPTPTFQPLLTTTLIYTSFPFNFSPRRFHVLKPCSSLKESKKKTLQKVSFSSFISQNPRLNNPKNADGADRQLGGGLEGETAVKGTILAGLLLVGVVGGFAGVGYVYKDQINAYLSQISDFIEGYGPAGYALFVAVYTGLEVGVEMILLLFEAAKAEKLKSTP